MHYDPRKRNHGLPHDPFNALVVPRPIGWISTVSKSGVVNLAPYSYFNAVSGRPPYVMFSSSEPKDSRRNAEETGEFVCNLATLELLDAMVGSSTAVGPEVSEPALIGLEMAPSVNVRAPRVKRSPAALECRYVMTVEIPDENGRPLRAAMVIGQVIGIYIEDKFIHDGRVDLIPAKPVSRLGYRDYNAVEAVFSMKFPDDS